MQHSSDLGTAAPPESLLWAKEMGGEEVEACMDFSFINSTMETEWVTRAELGRAFRKGFVFSSFPQEGIEVELQSTVSEYLEAR